jgi:RDD family
MANQASDSRLVGCMNLDRFFAAMIDHALAIVAGFVVATRLARYGTVASWAGAAVTYFACYLVSEVLFGNTLGKLSCGLSIRTLSGEKARRSQLLIRWCSGCWR